MGPARSTRSTTAAPSSSSRTPSPAPKAASPSSPSTKMSSPTPSSAPASSSSLHIKQLGTNVPHLDIEGTKWTMFALRFPKAMIAASCWGHFDSSSPCPVLKDSRNPTDKEMQAIWRWTCEDQITDYLLDQHIPKKIALDIIGFGTTKEHWDYIKKRFSAKSEHAKADLYQAFIDMKCPRNTNVREFLNEMSTKRHKLEAIGVTVSDINYRCTILCSLPNHLSAYASNTLMTLSLTSEVTGNPINMDKLLSNISDKADRAKLRRATRDQSQGKGKKGQTDEALAATTSERGGNRSYNNNGKKRCSGKCHHCGKEGHWVRECCTKKWEEAAATAAASNPSGSAAQANAGNSSKPENRPVGSANVATIDNSDDGDFWSATAEIVNWYDDPMMGEPEWCNEDEYTPRADLEGEGEDIYWPDPEGITWDIEEMAGATIAPAEEDEDTLPCTEMYDSGASRHISPHKADFTSYTPLSPPLYINAANKHKFPAIGTGTLVVKVPANEGKSDLILNNALYTPSMCYTLVSIGTLDKVEGYTFRIGGGCLQIITPHGKPVGKVLCNPRHLYKVKRSLESTYAAKDMSVMELHRRLGHISIATTRKLVVSRAIRRIKLDPDAPEVDSDCEACIIACATCLPMRKPHISTPAKNFRDEVHTDVWGPSKSSTKGGRRYFITFTDNATRFTLIYLISKKSEALRAYKFFEAWAITQQHGTRIKVLRLDCRGEYLSKEFNKHLAAAGTAQRLTTHDTPQLNGIAEWLNRMLLERI